MFHNPSDENKSSKLLRRARLSEILKADSNINILLVFIGIFLFLPRLCLELKLDELGSFWVIKDSLQDTIHRSLHLGQSPFYYIILWLSYKVFGSSEMALRIPSLLCILSSALLMIRLGTLLFSREVGVFSAFAFISSFQAIVAATDARPYALAILFTFISTLNLVEWCKTGSKRYLTFYCLSVTATIYAHYLFGLILVPHALWVIFNFNRDRKPLIKQVLVAGMGLSLLLIPALHHVREFSAKTEGKAFAKTPEILDLLSAVIPTESILLIVLIFIFHILVWKVPKGACKSLIDISITRGAVTTLAIFLLVPVLIIYAVSIFSGNSIFVERYFGQRIIGIGLLGGIMICSFHGVARRAILLSCLLLIIAINHYSYGFSERAGDGFGRAVHRIQTEDGSGKCQLLIMSGFIEAQTIGWLSGGLTREFIIAPLSYYKVKNPVTPIPYAFNTKEAVEYYSHLVSHTLDITTCVWLMHRNVELHVSGKEQPLSAMEIEKHLLENLGFRQSHRSLHGFVEVVGYQSARDSGSL